VDDFGILAGIQQEGLLSFPARRRAAAGQREELSQRPVGFEPVRGKPDGSSQRCLDFGCVVVFG